MARHRRESSGRPLGVVVVALVLVCVATGGVVLASRGGSTTTTAPSTTTTTQPLERPQAGWGVVSSSARGVMVDTRALSVDGATFRALRLRARTTLLRWHVGTTDPNLESRVPVDAGPAIFWPNEGLAGVVAAFNGGFKQSANAGGSVVDGVTLVALVRGRATIALDASGHWAMGVWGSATFPPVGFHAITYRQNLGPLVQNGVATAAALTAPPTDWGSPLAGINTEPRTALGVDANGNLLYVATMDHVLPAALARAMVAAGAVFAMELDMNPYWPIMGAASTPLRNASGRFTLQLPGSLHDASIYATGWTRDFFVALAEPDSWSCSWASPGLRAAQAGRAQPQRLALVGSGCASLAPTTTSPATTTSSGATTSVVAAP